MASDDGPVLIGGVLVFIPLVELLAMLLPLLRLMLLVLELEIHWPSCFWGGFHCSAKQ